MRLGARERFQRLHEGGLVCVQQVLLRNNEAFDAAGEVSQRRRLLPLLMPLLSRAALVFALPK